MDIAIYLNENKPLAKKAYTDIATYLTKMGHKHYLVNYQQDDWSIKKDTNLLLCIGGDGTLLRAARCCACSQIPVLGINGGHLGFLSATGIGKELKENLEKIFKGEAIIQKRMLLNITVKRAGKTVFNNLALNDCVLKTTQARATYLSVTYDKTPLKDYFGDGLIISTPTGSTAYSLAAGGPIAYPQMSIFLLTPICAHTLNQRPLVLPADKILNAQISKKGSGSINLSIDGQINFTVEQGDTIIIKKNKQSALIMLPKDYLFFNTLTSKLKWGSR